MLHQRERLAFALEPGDHLLTVHARADHFQRDVAADRLGLLGVEDDTHPALAQLADEPVRADRPALQIGGLCLVRRQCVNGCGRLAREIRQGGKL